MSLASCSNGDITPDENVTGNTSTAYAKVNITMGGVGTRADGGFEAGTQDEGTVNSITLVLYDESLTEVIGYGSIDNSVDASETDDNGVSDKYEKTIELTMLGNKEDAKKLVAYVNTSGDVASSVASVLTKTTEDFGAAGKFIMTSAGYFANGSEWTVATDIADGSLYDSAAKAEDGSATTIVYVERLAAKVTTSMKDSAPTTAEITVTGVDGAEYGLEFDADNAKWAPTGTAKSMYLLKNPWTETVASTSGSNRSFWAAGVNYTTPYESMQPALGYVSSNALRATEGSGIGMGKSTYTMEHTYGQEVVGDPNYNVLGAATSVILLGQYKVTGTDVTKFGSDTEGYDFYLLLNDAGGSSYTIFTEEELMQYLLKNTGAELYSDETDDSKITEENVSENLKLEWDGAKANYTLSGTAYTKSDDTFSEFTAFATTNARHYNLGYAYFFIPIMHNGGETAEVGQYGVVRNHSYKLNISEIKKLGAPLDDDHFGTDPDEPDPDDPGDEPIIPDPTNPVVIKAEIDVLSWHVLEHDVKL